MKIDGQAILQEVRANLASLDACKGPHDFHPEEDPKRKLFPKMKCSKCGGTISRSDYFWYKKGLDHARG